MDDLASHGREHVLSFNYHKRKDRACSTDPILVDSPSGAALSNASRPSYLTDSELRSLPAPQVSSLLCSTYRPHQVKRPRLQQSDHSSPRLRRSPTARAAAMNMMRLPITSKHESDAGSSEFISFAELGPSSSSPQRLRVVPVSSTSTPKIPSIDLKLPSIPPVQPLVNRQSLKELDLDTILGNPQLRHDALFDTTLQLRPTSSRRKREISENYWAAVTQELVSGCTCISFDVLGKPHPVVCVCDRNPPTAVNPAVAYSQSLCVFTLRMPSRIQPLLTELLEVLLSIIQPLFNASGILVNSFDSQMKGHTTQAVYMRSIFDPDLIQQELSRETFDPSGLFRSIGATLKEHCAPMRDSCIDAMVDAAQTYLPGQGGSKADAVKAVRMCMDILELMKLDVTNHLLFTLRPFFIRTSAISTCLLYRQLIISDPSPQHGIMFKPKFADPDLLQFNQEIQDIELSHPHRLQSGIGNIKSLDQKTAKLRDVTHEAALQIAIPSSEPQRRGDPSELFPSAITLAGCATGERTPGLAQQWIASNIRPGSALSNTLHKRLSDAAFTAVARSTFRGTDLSTSCKLAIDFSPTGAVAPSVGVVPLATRTTSLVQEIRSFGDRVSNLALIRLNAYLALKEEDSLLESS